MSHPTGDGMIGLKPVSQPPRGERVASHDPPARPFLQRDLAAEAVDDRQEPSRSVRIIQAAMGEVACLKKYGLTGF